MNFKKELNIQLGGLPFKELIVFRSLQKVLQKYFNCVLIEETHQHYVTFKSPSIGKNFKREISDLWIIVFSPKMKYARMTFLQAKFEKKLSKGMFAFNGDYFQSELLAKRPLVSSVSKHFNFPSDILAYSPFDTIGTYGIFYENVPGQIEMAYCAASDLSFNSGVKKTSQSRRRLYFPQIGSGCCIFKKVNRKAVELTTCLEIDCFLIGLLSLIIGGELHNNRPIQAFLKQYFNQFSNQPVVKQFIAMLDDVPFDSSELSPGANGNILLINTDERNG